MFTAMRALLRVGGAGWITFFFGMTSHADPAWRVAASAGWVAAIGVLVALAAAGAFFPQDGPAATIPEGLLPWTLHLVRLEPREKGFFATSLLLGSLGSLLGAGSRRGWRPRLGGTLLAFLALCLTVNEVSRLTLTDQASPLNALAAAAAAALSWLLLTARRSPAPDRDAFVPVPARRPPRWYVHAGVLVGILLVGLPAVPERVAGLIGFDMHPVSFLIGPALYFMGGDLLPGTGYYSQYSLGWGWIFHFLVAETAERTVLRYAVLTAVGTTLFHVGLYWLLNWFFRDWRIAAVISIAHLLLNFVTDRPFLAPSSTPLRYPLIPLVAFLLAWVLERDATSTQVTWRRRMLAAALGASVFLNTETGAYAAVAVALAFLLTAPENAATVLHRIAVLAAESLAVLMALVVVAYGTDALAPRFLLAQLEPFFLYGVAGLGAWPIEWKGFGWALFVDSPAAGTPCVRAIGLCAAWGEWNLFYQVVAPGMALATLGYTRARAGARGGDRGRQSVLAFHALLALLMSSKFINMSLAALWHVNSLGFLVVFGWWWKEFLGSSGSRRVVFLNVASGLLVLVLLTVFTRDPRNPALYGWQSWKEYPSPARAIVGPVADARCGALECMNNRPSPRDVALITQRTTEGEPVAMYDLFDWTYHIAGRRPPLSPFLPSSVIFTERQLAQYRERLLHARYVFVSADKQGFPFGVNTVFEGWEHARDFVEEARGERLIALRRRTQSEMDR